MVLKKSETKPSSLVDRFIGIETIACARREGRPDEKAKYRILSQAMVPSDWQKKM